jgi:hypothetical protein
MRYATRPEVTMRLRLIVPIAAGVAVAAMLALPAFGRSTLTTQVNVIETGSSCHLTVSSMRQSNLLILFHLVNTSLVPRGIIVWGVHSTMALPKGEANLFVKFSHPGLYPYACTANTYSHPKIVGSGILRLGANGRITFLPARGGGHGISA